METLVVNEARNEEEINNFSNNFYFVIAYLYLVTSILIKRCLSIAQRCYKGLESRRRVINILKNEQNYLIIKTKLWKRVSKIEKKKNKKREKRRENNHATSRCQLIVGYFPDISLRYSQLLGIICTDTYSRREHCHANSRINSFTQWCHPL